MTENGYVKSEVIEQVSWITFGHPKHNSMPSPQLKRLTETIISEGRHNQSKIIVLQSAGERTFCAGANFDELVALDTEEEAIKFFMGFANLILAIRNSEKLVIGRVQGKAVGGGLGIIAATDFCIANKSASVRLSELSIGIGPYVIEPAIDRKIGKAFFSKLALNPREWQAAQWARETGLFQQVFDDTSQMDDYLKRYLQEMTTYSTYALVNMKRMLWEDTPLWPSLLPQRAEMSASLLMRDETQDLLKIITGKN
jgi:methylglutaconyl-CoA hydratase